MNFKLTEEHGMIVDMVREFAMRELKPRVVQLDESERFDRDLFERMAELGFAALPWPEQVGGADGGFLSCAITLEELSKVCASIGAVLWAHIHLAAWPIFRFGNEELREKVLKPLVEGAKLGGGVLPESADTWADISVTEKQDGYVLNGSQQYVFNGEHADYFIVYARTAEYCEAFLVEKDTPGLHVFPVTGKLGFRGCGMAHLTFESCFIPKAHRIGSAGQEGTVADEVAGNARYGLAAIAAGIAQGAADAALGYAKERVQFGKPIGRHQAVAFMLADMQAAAESSKLLVYQAAWRVDQGLDAAEHSALALTYSAGAAITAATDGVQIFGGYGYMKEYHVERFMRDAKALRMMTGLGGELA